MKIFIFILLFSAAVIVITGCCSTTAVQKVTMPSNALLLDVRSDAEFQAGHLPGAVNIAHTEIAEKIVNTASDKSTPIYLYCRSGRRVGIAMKTLKKIGYTTMYNLGGLEEAAKKLNVEPTR